MSPTVTKDYYRDQESQLMKRGYTTVFICDPCDESFVTLRENAETAFERAYAEGDNSLVNRPEKASIDFEKVESAEELVVQILKSSEIIELLSVYLGPNIHYDLAFSKFRFVRHDLPDQMAYTPLHYDGAFLPGNSLNVCIPFTGYGGPFPGLNTWPATLPHRLARKAIGEATYAKCISRYTTPDEPYVTAGSALVFNEKVYHCRTVDSKSKSRLNLEFRFFPESAVGEDKLDLRPLT